VYGCVCMGLCNHSSLPLSFGGTLEAPAITSLAAFTGPCLDTEGSAGRGREGSFSQDHPEKNGRPIWAGLCHQGSLGLKRRGEARDRHLVMVKGPRSIQSGGVEDQPQHSGLWHSGSPSARSFSRSPSPPPPSFKQYPSPPRSLVRDGETSPLRPQLVVSRSTCPPLSPSPHANSFVIGNAVINTTSPILEVSDPFNAQI